MPSNDNRAHLLERTAENERRAWELRLQGWTERRIGDELGVHRSTVGKMLQRMEKRLAAEFRDHAEEVKARQTGRLERLFEELVEQWRRSCEDGVTETTVEGRCQVDKTTGEIVPLPTETRRTVSGQSGNPALLAQALKALADIRAIWGLDAPKRTDVTSEGEAFKVLLGDWPEKV